MNQQTNHEDNQQTESMTDLEMTTEQATQTKGGLLEQSGRGTHVAGTIGGSY